MGDVEQDGRDRRREALLARNLKDRCEHAADASHLHARLETANERLQRARMEAERLDQALRQSRAARDALVGSWPWRLTAPLRFLAACAGFFVRRGLRAEALYNAALVACSGLYDRQYYLRGNPDVAQSYRFPLLHLLRRGLHEQRRPSEAFDPLFYSRRYPDVAASGVPPLIHYLRWGRTEGRLPLSPDDPVEVRRQVLEHRLFDPDFYRRRYPDVAAGPEAPLDHFIRIGIQERRDPSAEFSTGHYLHTHPEVAASPWAPFVHYLLKGRQQGLDAVLREHLPDETAVAEATAALGGTARELFSVVMPTWNRRAAVAAAIDSVLAQSYREFELIVVDDGSTDDTVPFIESAYAREIASGRMRLLKSAHRGVSAARNEGLRAARGSWIAYLDSDNTWREHYLLFAAATARAHPGTQTLYAELFVHDEARNLHYVRRTPFSWESLCRENFIDLNVYAHHRSVTDELGGFDERLVRMVDWDMILRHTRRHPPHLIAFTLADYRLSRGLGNITHTTDPVGSLQLLEEKLTRSDGGPEALPGALTVLLGGEENCQLRVANQLLISWRTLASTLGDRLPGLASIVIPVFNLGELTRSCVESILSHTADAPFEVVLVDNGSDEKTAATLGELSEADARVRLLRPGRNLHYALGNNVGVAASRGEYVVLLNNDTRVTDGWLPALLAPLIQDATVGATGPKLLYEDGTVQCAGMAFSGQSALPFHLYQHFPGDAACVNRPRSLQATTGACLALRAADYIRCGGLDPSYVNGCEDLDLCFRIRHDLGKSVRYVPRAVVYHLESRTPGRGRRILQNRRIFVNTWGALVRPDDQDIFREDGYETLRYVLQGAADDRASSIFLPELAQRGGAPAPAATPAREVNVGLVSIWHVRGVTFVAKQLLDAIEGDGVRTHVLARWEAEKFFAGNPVGHPRVTNGGDDPPAEAVLDWARAHRLDAVVFCEVHPNDWKRVAALREAGVRVIACEHLDVLEKDHLGRYRQFDAFLHTAFHPAETFRRQFPQTPALTIPWGVPPASLPAPRAPQARAGDPLRFVHVAGWGGVNNRKNTDLLIRAWHRAGPKAALLRLYTQAPSAKYGPECARILRDDRSIELHEGTVDDIFEAYAGADMLLWPSKREGLGLPILEALACGLPVLIADGYLMKQWIIPGVHGVVCPAVPVETRKWLPELQIGEDDLAAMIADLAGHPERVAALAQQVRRDRDRWLWTWQPAVLRAQLRQMLEDRRYAPDAGYSYLPEAAVAFEQRRRAAFGESPLGRA